MSKLTTTVISRVSTTKNIELKTTTRNDLLLELRAYAELKREQTAIQKAMDGHRDSIGKLREETGEQSISLNGFIVTEIRGTITTLDKKKLIAQGVTVAQIEAATITRPKRSYEKITLPGEKTGEDA
jgi:hypothetical protein